MQSASGARTGTKQSSHPAFIQPALCGPPATWQADRSGNSEATDLFAPLAIAFVRRYASSPAHQDAPQFNRTSHTAVVDHQLPILVLSVHPTRPANFNHQRTAHAAAFSCPASALQSQPPIPDACHPRVVLSTVANGAPSLCATLMMVSNLSGCSPS